MNEHMMFKGTKSYGPGEIDRIIEGEMGGGRAVAANRRAARADVNNVRIGFGNGNGSNRSRLEKSI